MSRLSIFVIFCLISAFGQTQNAEIKFVDSVAVQYDTYFGKDVFGNDYFSQKNVLYKQNKTEKREYQNLSLGEIHSVDFTNSLKILLFYKNFNSVVLLDNQLSEIVQINLSDFNIVAQNCSMASQNRIWIYDALSSSLLLLDYLNKKTISLNQPFKSTFKYCQSDYNNWLRISENNELFSHNIHGKTDFLGIVPKYDQIIITENKAIIFSSSDNLYLRKNVNQESEILLWSAKNSIKLDYKNSILTIFTGKTIENYTLKLP